MAAARCIDRADHHRSRRQDRRCRPGGQHHGASRSATSRPRRQRRSFRGWSTRMATSRPPTGCATIPAATRVTICVRQLKTYARYGVTTVFSLGDDQEAAFQLRDEQSRGPLDRARVFVAGPVINGATAAEARAMTDKVAAMKPDLLKIRIDDNLGSLEEDAGGGVAGDHRARRRAQAAGRDAHLLSRRCQGGADGRRGHHRAQRARRAGGRGVRRAS